MLRNLLLTFFFIALPLQAADDRLLFYKAQHKGAEIYLLGSMHLASSEIYPLRKEIMQAFEAATTLVVEVDTTGDNQIEIQQLMLSKGTYPPGESIRDHLTLDTYVRLEEHAERLGLPIGVVASMRPGFLVTALSAMKMIQLGLSPEQGVDQHFLNAAQGKKSIASLETAEQQVDLLLGFPQPDLQVRQTLESLDSMGELIDELVALWKLGDAKSLQTLMLDDVLNEYPEYRLVYERMFDQRNHAMTAKIETFFLAPEKYFVVVGAGHLVGEEGIVSLLKNRGYKVDQL
jgi:uncharacterized protein YbaP (TraB family)